MNARVSLSFLLEKKDELIELVVPFPAFYMEDPRICTAVLERTAILASTEDKYVRITARHDQVYVDPGMVEWRTRTANYEGRRLDQNSNPKQIWPKQRRPKSPWSARTTPTSMASASVRSASDERARTNQQEIKEAEEKELQLLRRRRSPPPHRRSNLWRSFSESLMCRRQTLRRRRRRFRSTP